MKNINEMSLNEDQKELLESLNESEILQVNILLNDGYNVDESLKKYEDVQIYSNMGFTQLAESFVDEGLFGDIPENIENYIDYEAIGRELSYNNYNEFDINGEWGIYFIG